MQQYPQHQPQQPVVVVQGGTGKGCGVASIIIAIVVAVVLLVPGLIGLLVCGGSCAACTACGAEVSNQAAIQSERDREAIEAARAQCQPPMVFRLRDGGLSTYPADWECVQVGQSSPM